MNEKNKWAKLKHILCIHLFIWYEWITPVPTWQMQVNIYPHIKYMDGFVQDCSISSVLALDLCLTDELRHVFVTSCHETIHSPVHSVILMI